MPNREYYLAQAETCIKLAAASQDSSASARLIAMAEEFRAKSGHSDEEEFGDPFKPPEDEQSDGAAGEQVSEPQDDPRAG